MLLENRPVKLWEGLYCLWSTTKGYEINALWKEVLSIKNIFGQQILRQIYRRKYFIY